jgi:hypothetical protein
MIEPSSGQPFRYFFIIYLSFTHDHIEVPRCFVNSTLIHRKSLNALTMDWSLGLKWNHSNCFYSYEVE